MTDFQLPAERDRPVERSEPSTAGPDRVDHLPLATTTPRDTIMRARLSVGPAHDGNERDTDAVADRVVRAVRAAEAADTPISSHSARVQRSAIAARHVDSTTTIRRKIGNAGDPLIDRRIRRVLDPDKGKVGTIKSWSSGGGLWSLTAAVGLSNVVYNVQFDDGTQPISAGDEAYELLPASATAPAASSTPPPSAPSTPARDAAADAATTAALDALIIRIGKPLTDLNVTERSLAAARKAKLKQLQGMRASPDRLPNAATLQELTTSVDALESSFRAAADERDLSRQQAAEERARLEKSEVAAKATAETEAANKQRCGKNYGTFRSRVGDADQLAAFLRRTPVGQEGQLLACLQLGHDHDDLLKLLDRKITLKSANELLGRITDRPFEQIHVLLDHTKESELAELTRLVERTAPDKSVLVKLLDHLDGSAKSALRLMSAATIGSEASVLAMLVAGRSASHAESLLDTATGREDTAGAATISAGVADLDSARTLLDQPGVSGNAQQALGVLRHAAVGNDIAAATQLLNKNGNATDALALLQHGCSLVDAGKLLATTGISGAGADAVWCLANRCAVTDLVELLSHRTATEIRSYRAAGHRFEFIKRELAITPTQQFWAGEQCGAPAFTGAAATITDLINTATHPPIVGRYSGGNPFGNHGRVDTQNRPVMFLPPGNYHEYDLAPFTTAAERGLRRIVVGGGHKYYTSDHYRTFQRFA